MKVCYCRNTASVFCSKIAEWRMMDMSVIGLATIITQCKKTVSALILTHVAKLVL